MTDIQLIKFSPKLHEFHKQKSLWQKFTFTSLSIFLIPVLYLSSMLHMK